MPADVKSKPMIGAMMRGPGPARYALPSLMGKDKAYTMRPQLRTKDPVISPGPKYSIDQHMINTGKFPGRSSTFGIKPIDFKSTKGPGAAAYNLSGVKPGAQSPSYTMRPKTKQQKRFHTPGPNVYELQTLTGTRVVDSKKGSKASWTMTGRSDVGSFTQNFSKTPGPAKYSIDAQVIKRKHPSYSMGARCEMPSAGTKTPGPKFNVRREDRVKGGTFGIKHSEYIYMHMG